MDTVALIGRVLVSLAAVLGLMWVIARRFRKAGGGRHHKLVEVLGRQQLSRNASVAVVRVLDQALILGVTDGQVSVIGESDLDTVAAALGEQPRDAATPRSAGTPRPARAPRPPRTGRVTPVAPGSRMQIVDGRLVRVDADATGDGAEAPAAAMPAARAASGPLAGSALSPQTWKQTIDTLRDLTSRAR